MKKTVLNCNKIAIVGGTDANLVDVRQVILENNGYLLHQLTSETETVILYDGLICDRESLRVFLELRANDTLTNVWTIDELGSFVKSNAICDTPLFKGLSFFVPEIMENVSVIEQIKINGENYPSINTASMSLKSFHIIHYVSLKGGNMLTAPAITAIVFSNVAYTDRDLILTAKSNALVLKKEWLQACDESGALDIYTEYEDGKLSLPPIGVARVVEGFTATVPIKQRKMREAVISKLVQLKINVVDDSAGELDFEKADIVVCEHFVETEPTENARTLTCLVKL